MKEQKSPDNARRRKGEGEEEESMKVWDCGSPLYDSYELATLSHVIDRHMMILPSLSLMSRSPRRTPSPQGPAVAAATTTTARDLISVASNKIKNGRGISSSSSIIIGSKIKMITRSSSSSVFSAFLNKLAWKTSSSTSRRERSNSKPR